MKGLIFPEKMEELLTFSRMLEGDDHNIGMAQEEAGELITVINQAKRGRKSKSDIAEEVADVLMTACGVAEIVGVEKVNEWLQFKTDRMEQRMAEAQEAVCRVNEFRS